MITDIKNEKYRKKLEIFAKEICPLCKLCGKAPVPEMCFLYWAEDSGAFISEILARIVSLKTTSPTLYHQIKTYPGFVSVFCTSSTCPAYTYNCITDISISMGCYEIFLTQSGRNMSMMEKNRLLIKHLNKNLNDVKTEIQSLNTTHVLGVKHYLAAINKKKRKRFKKRVSNTRIRINKIDNEGIKSHKQYNDPWFVNLQESWTGKPGIFDESKKQAKKMQATTTTFSNEDDEGWRNKINGYLHNE